MSSTLLAVIGLCVVTAPVAARSTPGSALSSEVGTTGIALDASPRPLAAVDGQWIWSADVVRARPIIGVIFDSSPRETDKYGVYITAVTPGGPADKAGIRAGDVITSIDGKSLTDRPERPGNAGWSLPAVRLIEIVAKLDVGQTVDVVYRRGEESGTVKVRIGQDDSDSMGGRSMSARLDSMMWVRPSGRSSDPNRSQPRYGPPNFGGRSSTVFGYNRAISDLELAPLNEKLGAYFGISSGVLVINTAKETAFGLQPGDVITAIDSRKVSDPMQFMRALRSYDSGEHLKIVIFRNRKVETLHTKMP